MSGRRRGRGFTVIELMMVVVILVILISIAGPDLRNLILATRIKNASFDVYSTLTQARSEAVTRNTTVTITPTGTWVNGWTISCNDATVCKDPNTNAPPLIIRRHDAYDGITISGGPATISFNGMGRLTTTGTEQFTIDATGASAKNKRCISISASGRPATKEGACT
jgi:type IV fimbrial biogenesis protein FimT